MLGVKKLQITNQAGTTHHLSPYSEGESSTRVSPNDGYHLLAS